MTQFKPVSFHDLPGWKDDDFEGAFTAQKKSCELNTQSTGDAFCQALAILKNPMEYRLVLETFLTPYQIMTEQSNKVLFTGYYEPLLYGSFERGGIFQTPLYKFPNKDLHDQFPRSLIRQGFLDGRNLELLWVDDPIAAFFLEIQGSGRVCLPNGEIVRIGYAGCNGYPYFAIGKSLIERGAIEAEHLSLQSIKRWLYTHPQEAEDMMDLNASYVFFKILEGDGPMGTQGVPLTPQRSLAVDPLYIPLGTPVWVDAQDPLTKAVRFQKLMVAQDTGGAIKGALRADVFWGFGHEAELSAGHMKSEGHLYILLPKSEQHT